MITFSPNLHTILSCPKRFYLERVLRRNIPAPFASSVMGQEVHKRIAKSLRTSSPVSTAPLPLPRRVILGQDQDLEELMDRAQQALYRFNACREWLGQYETVAVEHRITLPYFCGAGFVQVGGVIDLILKTPQGEVLIDWKTGSYAAEQLKFYLLRYYETLEPPKHAEAISLGTGESLCVVHWEESLNEWFEEMVMQMQGRLQPIAISFAYF
jgi:hypothetical protein